MHGFQLIYARGMFRGDEAVLEVLRQEVSTHICAGNVSWPADVVSCRFLAFQLIYVWGMFHVSNAACPSGLSFQLIYVRGMFLFIFDNSIVLNNVSTHICAGNVSAFMRGFAILDGANPQELDCSLWVRVVIYRMR